MPYLGKSPNHGNFTELTDVSGSFDGSTTQFALTSRIGGVAITPVIEAAVLISINGVIQEPTTDYTVSGTNITFTSAPASTDSFFGTVMGFQLDVGTPSDSTVTAAKLASTFLSGATDIGAAIVDADLLLIDDGAGGTFRKTTASRLTTYIDKANPASADGDSLGTASLEWSDLYLADGGVIYFGNDQDINITHVADTGLTTNGDFSVGDDLKLTSDSAVIHFGADSDITLTHAADTSLTTNGVMVATTFEPSADVSAGDNAAIGYQSGDGLVLIGQGGNNDITIKNDTKTDVLKIATGTTDVTFANDLKLLSDSSVIHFGADSDVTVTHDPDDGLILKSNATPDGNPFLLTLQTGETDMEQDDIIGRINFQAPDEGTGTDAILVAARISAMAEGDFSSSSNATKLSFATASSEAAQEKMKLSSTGQLTLSAGSFLPNTDTDTSNTGSVTLDFAVNQNFVLTFTGNVTLANPSTETAGQSGVIVCIQDGTGSRTLSLGTDYETAGGAGITLSTAANSVDVIPYFVKAAGSIQLGAVQKAFS